MKIYIAPMAGVTDFAFRQILKEYNPDLMYTEMVNSTLFSRENEKTLNTIMRMSKDEISGIQLFGSDIQNLYENFKKLHKMGYTNLLLNMGCPQNKILKSGSGAGLLNRVDDIRKLLSMLDVEGIKISLKIRLSDFTDEYFKLANEFNIPFLCVHIRSKEEMFGETTHFEEIVRLSKIKRNFKLIANGGIFSLKDYLKFKEIDIDGVMLARGVIGNPWLIKELKEEKEYNVSIEEIKNTLINHIYLIKEDKGEKKAVIEINKFIENYFKNFNVDYMPIILENNFENKIKLIKSVTCN